MLVPTALRKGCRDAHCASADAHPRSVAAKWYVRFACGKLHSLRMPDEQCSSLRRHGKNVGTSIARPRLRSKQSPGRAIPPALRRYGTLDLPAANCIRSECRTSNARPYVRFSRRRGRGRCGQRPLRVRKCVGTSIARPRLRSKQSPGRAISLRCSGT